MTAPPDEVEPMTGPTARCVCGHVQLHHGKQEMAQLPYYPNCQWRGCGCPRFVAAPSNGCAPPCHPHRDDHHPSCALAGAS